MAKERPTYTVSRLRPEVPMFRPGPHSISLSPENLEVYEVVPRGIWLEAERLYVNGIASTGVEVSTLLSISTGRRIPPMLIDYHFHMERDRLDKEQADYLERVAAAHEMERQQNAANPSYDKYVRQATFLGALLEGTATKLLFDEEANYSIEDLRKLVGTYSQLVASDPSVGRQKRKESVQAIQEVQKELLDPEATGMDAGLQKVLAHVSENRETADDILEELQDLQGDE